MSGQEAEEQTGEEVARRRLTGEVTAIPAVVPPVVFCDCVQRYVLCVRCGLTGAATAAGHVSLSSAHFTSEEWNRESAGVGCALHEWQHQGRDSS